MLQCVAVCCSVLQCVVMCIVLQCVVDNAPRTFAGDAGSCCCTVLYCVAVCRSVLQRVAACCIVLQCAADNAPGMFPGDEGSFGSNDRDLARYMQIWILCSSRR